MSFRFSKELESREDLGNQLPKGAAGDLHPSVLQVQNMTQKCEMRGPGQSTAPSASPLGKIQRQKGAKMPARCSVSTQGKMRLSKCQTKILTVAWGRLGQGNCHVLPNP